MTVRMQTATRLALGAVLCLVALCGACSRPAPGPDRQAQLAALDPEARRLYAEIEREQSLRRAAPVLELGDRLLAEYPAHPYADVVAAWMIDAALRLPAPERAAELAAAYPRRFPGSDRTEAAMLAAIDGLGPQRPGDALRVLARLVEVVPDPARRQEILQRAPALAAALADGELPDRARELAGTAVAPWLRAQLEARALDGAVAPAPRVEPGRLGVLVPLTGRFARYGNAFLSGVRQAAAAEPAPAGGAWDIRHEDTEGDVVGAALAARRLIEDEHCQILVGALLSNPTAAAALVADHHGVPLVSPTATHERLGLLGEHILQTNRTGLLEAEILARLACTVLLKQRFAIIRPDSPEGAAQAADFREAIGRHGGHVVLEEVFDAAATDFRAQVQRLRAARPEMVFAPATVDQMILLGPQLDFYRVGALVLGLGEWNSARLLQRAGSVMEHAIFPAADVMFPAEWSAEFAARWPAGQHDEEATRVARSAYLATRLVLQAMSASRHSDLRELVAELRGGVTGRRVDTAAIEALAATVRTIEGGQIVPFPAHLYAEAMARRAAEAAGDDAGEDREPAEPAPAGPSDAER